MKENKTLKDIYLQAYMNVSDKAIVPIAKESSSKTVINQSPTTGKR